MKRAFLAMVLLVAWGCSEPVALGPDSEPLLAKSAPGVRPIARIDFRAGGGSSNFGSPVGMVTCLIGGRIVADFTLPYPDLMLNDALVGCDRSLPMGANLTIRYDAGNTPGFASMADQLTNGVSELLFTWAGCVEADMTHSGAAGGSGNFEDRLRNPPGKYPDLVGFEIEFIELEVTDVEWGLLPNIFPRACIATGTWTIFGTKLDGEGDQGEANQG